MTTIASPVVTTNSRFEAGRRILAVTRLHFVNRVQILYTPLLALAAIFLLNYAIWWIVIAANSSSQGTNHLGYSGAVSYIYIYGIVIAVQSTLRTFPFSLGFGVTRRDYYLGSALAFVTLSTLFAVVLTVMSVIEIATNGWGVGGRMFAPVYFTNSFWLARFVMYLLVFLFCLFVGTVIATVYMRWRATGIFVFFLCLGIVLLGAIAWITVAHGWPGVGNWFATTGTFGIVLWTLVPSAVSAAGGLLIIRRATPKA